MDDKVILQKIRQGSREALGLLWQGHSAHVLNLAFRMLKDRDAAEDILMDIFVQVPKASQNFRGESALGTWLYKLTVNACLMKLRAHKRHLELEGEHHDDIMESALGDYAESSESNGFIQCSAKLLEEGLSKLNAETRSMLWLKDAEGLDVKDLADIYKMPEGTIKARLSRARHFIKEFVKNTDTETVKEPAYA